MQIYYIRQEEKINSRLNISAPNRNRIIVREKFARGGLRRARAWQFRSIKIL